jgi:hypothetical protein
MGKHGDITTYIYRDPPKVAVPPIEVQRQIIAWAKKGVSLGQICKSSGYYLPTVKLIIERGVVFLKETEKPVRCEECGARLVASPCLRCELLLRNN